MRCPPIRPIPLRCRLSFCYPSHSRIEYPVQPVGLNDVPIIFPADVISSIAIGCLVDNLVRRITPSIAVTEATQKHIEVCQCPGFYATFPDIVPCFLERLLITTQSARQ